VNGKRKRLYLYGKTRKAVAAKLKAALQDQQQGVNLTQGRVTVAQFLERWLDEVVRVRNRPRTYYGYKGAVARYLVPHIGAIMLHQLTPADVQALIGALLAVRTPEPLAAATVRYARDVLNRALNTAVAWGFIARNPAHRVAVPRDAGRTITPLTVEQARQLLAALQGHRLEALYRVALSLGLRRGEVLGLRWVDVDLNGATITITGGLQRVNNVLERTPPKTAGSAATLPLPPALVRALRQHHQRQEAERAACPDWQEHGYVFPSRIGTPFEPTNLNRHLKALLRRAGLPRIRVHDLRHSCASLLIAQDVHPKVIQTILRHANISTTMDVYGHVFPAQHREASATVADLLEERDPSEAE
jgi:integrase